VTTLQEKGIQFAVATGRPAAALQPIIDQLGVDSIPAITFNGACLQYAHPKAPSTPVWEEPLPSDLARAIVRLLDSTGLCISYSTRTAAVALVKTDEHRSILSRYEQLEGVKQDKVVATAEALVTAVANPPLKIVGLSKHPDADAKAARNALSGKPVHVISAEMHIEFVCQGVNKATALRRLCEELQQPMATVVAFGDAMNDMEMLVSAGLGIAMANARVEVKEAAAEVCKYTNTEDGVAMRCEELIAEARLMG